MAVGGISRNSREIYLANFHVFQQREALIETILDTTSAAKRLLSARAFFVSDPNPRKTHVTEIAPACLPSASCLSFWFHRRQVYPLIARSEREIPDRV